MAEKYYTPSQQDLHRQFYTALHSDIIQDISNDGPKKDQMQGSAVDRFLTDHAGEILMYGASLSKQYLDPAHYPQDLEIRNNHKPFLYRYALVQTIILYYHVILNLSMQLV